MTEKSLGGIIITFVAFLLEIACFIISFEIGHEQVEGAWRIFGPIFAIMGAIIASQFVMAGMRMALGYTGQNPQLAHYIGQAGICVVLMSCSCASAYIAGVLLSDTKIFFVAIILPMFITAILGWFLSKRINAAKRFT
jgi:hypothetical protein